MPEENQIRNNSRGFIALIAIIIIFGVALMLGLSVSSLGISEAGMSLQKSLSSHAFYLANLCAEEALMKLKENNNYTGETMSIGEGACQVSIKGNWTIEARGDFKNQVKKIRIIVTQINPEILVQSWQEVADF